MTRDRLFHYVRIAEVERWLAVGWYAHPSLQGSVHGLYSCLLEWLCDCEPRYPA